MTEILWRIYYGGGATFDNMDGWPKGDRARGGLLIAQRDESVGVFYQSGTDYYVYRDGRWWGVDLFGLYDFLLDSGMVVFGRTVHNNEFREVFARAKNDPDFPRKSGFKPGERHP